jgi:predicted Rossmann fold flavoprotein
MSKKIGVIGGGAAGFFAAIRASEVDKNAEVKILEGSKKPLAKVLISGGGRCNVTNNTLDINTLLNSYPRGSLELRAPFNRFAVPNTVSWFNDRGVKLKTEPDNRMFPVTDSSATIADCLMKAASLNGVKLELNSKVTDVAIDTNKRFRLTINNSTLEEFDTLIFATGGIKSAYTLVEKLGHTVIKPVPSLFTFEISDPLLHHLEGISFPKAELKLIVKNKSFKFSGPILITHWGLSGPAVIKLSALAARELYSCDYNAELEVNFIGEERSHDIFEFLTAQKKQFGKKQLKSIVVPEITKRFWHRILEVAKIRDNMQIANATKKQLQIISNTLTAKNLVVTGKGVFKEEFVTCGGVDLKQVDFKTMQSKIVPNLYFAGEVLNIDGVTGGFNFQSAWTTGWIAGGSC